MFRERGIPVERIAVMAAFGCNFEGEIPVPRILAVISGLLDVADEAGIATGIDLERLIEASRFAEQIFGRTLPRSVMKGGSLDRFRKHWGGGSDLKPVWRVVDEGN
jgi:hypothetical protein